MKQETNYAAGGTLPLFGGPLGNRPATQRPHPPQPDVVRAEAAQVAKPEVERDARHHSQRAQILARLRERGAAGASNVELNELCFRYGARIFELRRLGYQIETRSEGDGVFRFVLASGNGTHDEAKQKSATAGRPVEGELKSKTVDAAAASWPGAVPECSGACRCLCHSFPGADRRPCIACPPV